MRAVGYYQYSSDVTSPEKWEGIFREYCRLNLHQPTKIFIDERIECAKKSQAYNRMLDFFQESQSNFLVVIPDATHLGNNLESVVRKIIDLEKTGSKIICVDEELPDPIQSALLMVGTKDPLRQRGYRIKEAMQAKALKGQGLGKPPYGYRTTLKGNLEIVKKEADVVRLIYQQYTKENMGLRRITQHLNKKLVPAKQGGNWNMSTIRDILRNPTYIGTYTRFGLRIPKMHESIVSNETFRAVKDKTKAWISRNKWRKLEPFLLSGIAYCGYCNNKMMGVTRHQHWRQKSGQRVEKIYRYYQCQSKNNQSICGYHTWRAKILEDTILSQLKTVVLVKNLPEPNAKHENQSQAIHDRLVINSKRQFIQALRRTATGELNIDVLSRYLTNLEEARLQSSNPKKPLNATQIWDSWENMSIKERHDFLLEHISNIVVKDTEVHINP
jgi:site-specific DNA recombinase